MVGEEKAALHSSPSLTGSALEVQPPPSAKDLLIIQPHPTLMIEDSDCLDATCDVSQGSAMKEEPSSHKHELLVTGARLHWSASTLSYKGFSRLGFAGDGQSIDGQLPSQVPEFVPLTTRVL